MDMNNVNMELQDEEVKTNDVEDGIKLSPATLASLKERPTSLEVKQMINSSKEETIEEFNNLLNNIFNTRDAISKIRNLIDILNDKEVLSSLHGVLDKKIDMKELENHIKSGIHITNNDRKALNILLYIIKSGFVDWNAEDGELNSIKNKPSSLQANGGNAETIGGLNKEVLINKSIEDFIIGQDGGKYNALTVDHIYKHDNPDRTNRILEDNIKNGSIYLRNGIYYSLDTSNMVNNKYGISFIGNKRNTAIIDSNIKLHKYFTLKDLYFNKSNIRINSECNISDCEFNKCRVYLEDSLNNIITNNRFNNCEFIITGTTGYNIITNNIFYTNAITYIGGNNIIENNLLV